MNQAYYETLPRDYFGDLYERVKNILVNRENVGISVIPGNGSKTIFNFLYHNFLQDKLFEQILLYDPEIETLNIIKFTKKIFNNPRNTLLIVRFFNQIKHKPDVLEKLDSFRRRQPEKLVYLIFTNEEPVINPEQYQANSTVFFNEIFTITPFSLEQTKKMMATLEAFYGWKVNAAELEEIFKLSGGIPRLIKYLTKELFESHTPLNAQSKLTSNPQINFQLKLLTKLIYQLSKFQLHILGLVDNKGRIRSQLLQYYLQAYRSDILLALYPNLGMTEAKVCSFLIENEGKIVTLDKIAELMHMSDESFSLWGIYKLVSRLKTKIQKTFTIKNVKGRGYLLIKTI